jgi:hypothetical protein
MQSHTSIKRLPSISELYKQSYTLFRKTILKSLALFCVYILLPLIITVGSIAIITNFLGAFALWLIIPAVVVMLYLGTRVGVASIHLMYSGDQTKTYTEYWAMSKGGTLRVFFVNIGKRLLIDGGLLLLFVPGVIFALRYLFTLPVYVLESENNPGFKKSLAKSRLMTEGNKLNIFGALLAVYFPAIVIIILSWLAGFALFTASVWIGVLVCIVLFFASIAIFWYLGCSIPVLYHSLKNDTSAARGEKEWFIVVMIVLGLIFNIVLNIAPLASKMSAIEKSSTEQDQMMEQLQSQIQAPEAGESDSVGQ